MESQRISAHRRGRRYRPETYDVSRVPKQDLMDTIPLATNPPLTSDMNGDQDPYDEIVSVLKEDPLGTLSHRC